MTNVPQDPDAKRRSNLEIVAAHMLRDPQSGPEPPPDPERKSDRGRWGRWGMAGGLLALLLGKFKFVIGLLKFAKFSTLLSMLVAVWAYAMFWGLPFAVGFVLLIFVHEMGHAVAMRQMGVPAGAPVFIPFVGAVIAMKGAPRDAYVEAVVGIGGPALGTVGAAVCLLIGRLTGEPFWYALASTGFLINLFNMIPISPLDGGRIVGVISRWFWALGYAIGILVFWKTRSPILFLILLLGLFSLGRAIRGERDGYFDVPAAKRGQIALSYFGLLAVMALGMWVAQEVLVGVELGV